MVSVMSKKIFNKMEDVLGKDFETNSFGKCFIIDYKNCNEVTVIFYKPFSIVKCSMSNLKGGRVSNPMKPTVYGKGYIGAGEHTPTEDVRFYKLWKNMLERTYCLKTRYRRKSYKDVTVCEEWLNFQNFTKWCYSQSFSGCEDQRGNHYELDKDILVKGNKVYSPETCCFVPHEINSLLVLGKSCRGEFVIGVGKGNRKFTAQVSKKGDTTYLGVFNTPEEAFSAYKVAKEANVKLVADQWKSKIEDKVYQSLLNWEITFDD